MLLVGWQEGHLACKWYCHDYSRKFTFGDLLLGTSLTWRTPERGVIKQVCLSAVIAVEFLVWAGLCCIVEFADMNEPWVNIFAYPLACNWLFFGHLFFGHVPLNSVIKVEVNPLIFFAIFYATA